jgi:hypothetical protein
MYVKRFVGVMMLVFACTRVCVCVCVCIFFIFYLIKKLKINNELSLQLLYYEYIERPLAAFPNLFKHP